jgi:aryl-alcohol dehydrogenase-like predicted oxidoreductase
MNVVAKKFFILTLFFMSMSPPHSISQNIDKATSLRHIAKINRDVTFIGFGAIEIGRDWGIGTNIERQPPDEQTSKEIIHAVLDNHINVIDTASSYHLSEPRLGKYLGNARIHIMLNTKAGEHNVSAYSKKCKIATHDKPYCEEPAAEYDFSKDAIRNDVEESLKRLKTTQLDTVFIHFDDQPKEVIDKGDAVAELKQLKKEGKIRYIGASLDDVAQTKRAIESGDYDAIEVEYNLLNQSQQNNIRLAHQKGLGVFVRGGVGTGLLTTKVKPYINDPQLPFRDQIIKLLALTHHNYDQLTALALEFLYENKNIDCVIIGSKNPPHFKKDLELLNHFNQPKLLERAIAMTSSNHPKVFSNSVDAYFKEKYTKT